jgi:PAT family beta-lactamase induction signal transducer AmpG
MHYQRTINMFLLGFSSGLPLALTSGTLQAWLTVAEVDIRTIGLFSLVGLPYTLKFLWSPFMDRFVPPWLGRRRGWLLAMQLGLLLSIAGMAGLSPETDLALIGVLAVGVAFLSASQDIAFDAYRADILPPSERGWGAGLSVSGYRIAMLVSGGVALILSERIGWPDTYLFMAGLMLIGSVATLTSPEPRTAQSPPASLLGAFIEPLKEFLVRPHAIGLLFLVVLYKFGDAFAGALTTSFLIRGLGFTATDVGVVNKGVGLAALLLGSIGGGMLLPRLGMFPALLVFGALQALTNLGFWGLTWLGKDYLGMTLVVVLENLSGGMGTAVFVALLMSLCNHRYTATQYALLSAISALGRVLLAPASGYLVAAFDWGVFFLVTFVAALPGLWLVWRLRETLRAAGAS